MKELVIENIEEIESDYLAKQIPFMLEDKILYSFSKKELK